MRSLSASASKGFLLDVWANPAFGVDSFVGKLTSVMQGSSETTFYVVALYCGSVNIVNTRYVLGLGLLADLAAIVYAILFSYLLF
jgi:spore maturation protein SpmB